MNMKKSFLEWYKRITCKHSGNKAIIKRPSFGWLVVTCDECKQVIWTHHDGYKKLEKLGLIKVEDA